MDIIFQLVAVVEQVVRPIEEAVISHYNLQQRHFALLGIQGHV